MKGFGNLRLNKINETLKVSGQTVLVAAAAFLLVQVSMLDVRHHPVMSLDAPCRLNKTLVEKNL